MNQAHPLIPTPLYQGYRQFRDTTWRQKKSKFESVAAAQHPHTMIISCADARVDPATIFSAGPGDLFVSRNIAALVPPFEKGDGLHGVSAAIEFAVCTLAVKNVVVLGHGECGGIAACIASEQTPLQGKFVPPWVALAAPARDLVQEKFPHADAATRQRHTEHEAISLSLENLRQFDFIAERLATQTLNLHGAWYSVFEGRLAWRDPKDGSFATI